MKRPASPNPRARMIALALCGGCALLTGCGGAAHDTATTRSSTTSSSTTATLDATAQLEDAVREVLKANGRLSVYVLWNNKVPSWASRSTRGPALTDLVASAKSRGKQGIRVRSLSAKVQVLAVQLAPSYTSATATVHDRERVALYKHGRRERTVMLDERDEITLHRLGQARRFVVWEVQPKK